MTDDAYQFASRDLPEDDIQPLTEERVVAESRRAAALAVAKKADLVVIVLGGPIPDNAAQQTIAMSIVAPAPILCAVRAAQMLLNYVPPSGGERDLALDAARHLLDGYVARVLKDMET